MLRFVHFTKLGPFVVDPQIILPIGAVHDAHVAGQNLGSSTGVGDALIFATIWLVNKPTPDHSTYLGFSPIVQFPTGTYDHNNAVNFGNNRWSFDPQLGFIQGLGKNVTFDIYGDVNWFGVNDDAGPLSQRLVKKAVSHVQTYLRYALPDKATVALGYAGYWGGKEYLDGIYTGTRTEHQQIRVAWQKFVAPKWQLELIGARDVQAREGFREAARVQVRVLKIL
ncbi:MAG: transporter [Janthinobacterium lividum]